MSQCDQLLKHLQAGHSITTLAAFRLFMVCRLSDRMRDLRKRGINVQSKMVTLKSGKRVAIYWLPTPTLKDAV
jgi:hypothetical protein